MSPMSPMRDVISSETNLRLTLQLIGLAEFAVALRGNYGNKVKSKRVISIENTWHILQTSHFYVMLGTFTTGFTYFINIQLIEEFK